MVTLLIIIFTVVLSIAGFNSPNIFHKLLFDPYLVTHKKENYRVISHAFLHGGWMHLLINMYVLWGFGTYVEASFIDQFGGKGILFYLVLYFGGIIASSLPTLQKEGNNPYYRSIGASGAVAAVLFSYILMNPLNTLYFFGIIPIYAVILGGLYLWYEKYQADRDVQDGIGHDAHYYGAIYGFLVTIMFRPDYILEFFGKISNFFG